jgi:hypothetical protein
MSQWDIATVEEALTNYQARYGTETVRAAIRMWETQFHKKLPPISVPATPARRPALREPWAPRKGAKVDDSDCSQCGSHCSSIANTPIEARVPRQVLFPPLPAGILYDAEDSRAHPYQAELGEHSLSLTREAHSYQAELGEHSPSRAHSYQALPGEGAPFRERLDAVTGLAAESCSPE